MSQLACGILRVSFECESCSNFGRRTMAVLVPPGVTVVNSLAEVVVPPNTPPGGKFSVYLKAPATRDGRARCKLTELWAASGTMPAQQPRKVSVASGWRHEHRPSNYAKQVSGTHAKAIDHVTSDRHAAASWATDEPAPFEAKQDDVGWLPGPVGGDAGRAMPAFAHPGPHCRRPRITQGSSARTIMKELCWFPARVQYILAQTKAKSASWCRSHPVPDGIERAWAADNTTAEHLELHLVAKVRIARLNPAIRADVLWDDKHDLYDSRLDAALPYDCFRWLNRHLCFGDAGVDTGSDESDSEAEDGQEQAHDRFRKGRAASDLVREEATKVFCCGQHVVWDDWVRVTRHLDGTRQRHKAALHTGCTGEGIACCKTNYIVSWEERGWIRGEAQHATGSSGAANGAGGSDDTVSGTGGGVPGWVRPAQQQSGSAGRGRGRGRGGRGRGRGSGRGRGAAAAATADEDETDDEADGSDSSDDGSGDEAAGVNATASRFERAVKALQPNVGHCVWMDNGLGTIKVLKACRRLGHHGTSLMNVNRVGIPRRLIALLRKRVRCPKGCSHEVTSEACTRFSWFVMHKGPWELSIWFDIGNQVKGKGCVISVSDCTSCTRTNTLSRTVGRRTQLVAVPEPIGGYNLYGRHGLDISDQQRKRLSLAHRRLLRQGPKRHLFDMEISFCNGVSVRNTKRDVSGDAHDTVWDFADEYCDNVLSAVSMRRRSSGIITAATAQQTTAATRAALESHVPINFQVQARRAKRAGDADPPKRKRGRKCCDAPNCLPGELKQPTLFCAGCKRERTKCSGWYCESCFWKRHKCTLVVD